VDRAAGGQGTGGVGERVTSTQKVRWCRRWLGRLFGRPDRRLGRARDAAVARRGNDARVVSGTRSGSALVTSHHRYGGDVSSLPTTGQGARAGGQSDVRHARGDHSGRHGRG